MSYPNNLSDHDFLVAALAGELGAEAQHAASGAARTAEDMGYSDDTARVAATARAYLDD
jgi:hypothetical protein